MSKDKQKPEWVPEGHGEEFASNVIKGVEGGHDGLPDISAKKPVAKKSTRKPALLTVEDFVKGILKQDRTILGRAITLVESNSPDHFQQAQEVLKQLLPLTGNSIRIGVTGVPGGGKSTFIEALGLFLIEKGHHVAVLAIDPTSSISRGSILGDKTRMEKLTRHPHSFIRPSPSGGALGGVARKTRETMLVCEAAGFDVILAETIGVGQSEITVRSMVDFFLLLQIAGGGDELQGLKKGVMELADVVLVNKADGENKPHAEAARQDLEMALHYLAPATGGWITHAFTCSALSGEGIPEIWKVIEKFRQVTTGSGLFEQRRRRQLREWMLSMVKEHLQELFFRNPGVQSLLSETEAAVMAGELPATTAAQKLLKIFEESLHRREKK
jgi:LAO/AO transport system kinase